MYRKKFWIWKEKTANPVLIDICIHIDPKKFLEKKREHFLELDGKMFWGDFFFVSKIFRKRKIVLSFDGEGNPFLVRFGVFQFSLL